MFSLIDRLLRRRPVLLAVIVGVVVAGLAAARVIGEVGAGAGGTSARCEDPVAWDDADAAVGDDAAVVGPVARVTRADDVGGRPTFVNLGTAYPDEPRFDVVVYEATAREIDDPLAALEGETVCAVGEVRERDGVPQIVVDLPRQLRLVD